MAHPRPLTILVVPDKCYPVQHALLEHIFARQLLSRGHKVLWLVQAYDSRKLGERRAWGQNDVYLIPIKQGRERKAQLANMFYFRPRGMLEILHLIRLWKVDIVLVRNDLLAAVIALVSCRLTCARLVYYLGFPLLEAGAESARGGWNRTRWAGPMVARLGLPLRNWVTRRADFVFTMSDYWREDLISCLEVPSERIMALPFGFDTSIHPDKFDKLAVRHQFGLEGSPTLFYMGTIGPPRDVTILAGILKQVVSEIPEARLLILVGQRQEAYIPPLREAFADQGVLEKVVFAPPVPHHLVSSYIAAADVGLSPIEPIPIYNVSSPAKLVEMMGMACPVVASNTPEQESVLDRSGGGLCVPHSAEAFGRAAVHLLRNPQEARAMGRRGRQFVEAHRSFEVLASKVEDVFLKLTVGG